MTDINDINNEVENMNEGNNFLPKNIPTRINPGDQLEFTFDNWKGRTRQVRMIFESVSVGVYQRKYKPSTTSYPTIFLNGHDLDKNARRSYDVDSIDCNTLTVIPHHETVYTYPLDSKIR